MAKKRLFSNKKAQAAMEFLTTYGWAMIVLTGSISALFYYGVFDFDSFTKEVCRFDQNMGECDGIQASIVDKTVLVYMSNNKGYNLEIKGCDFDIEGFDCTSGSCEITDDSDNYQTPTVASPVGWSSYDMRKILLTCTAFEYGNVIQGTIDLDFSLEGSTTVYKMRGYMQTKNVFQD